MIRANGIDWDGLGTFALTLVLVAATAGLPLLIAAARVLNVGLKTVKDPDSDLLVVFGKRLVEDRPDRDYCDRLKTAARLASGRPQHSILILGGRTGDASLSEAEAGAQLLRMLPGGAMLNIGLEQASADTLTNLRNLRELLAGAEPQPLTLITNRYHLARVVQMADSLSLPHRPCAAEGIGAALRPSWLARWPLEAFYVTWFTTGKLWARLTGNQRMLARVT
ncbi:MAG: YdcF family protein [Lamprobacter sp.]|uniref:YdcF family protein n=1 Tax=Lamprobacter sp. TaxID=3100796 RepID=UPI002B25CE9F|nr:YdcF family protein [Lamprobacter sp.]MEA3640605.1 YdcF family protein [Lamprobacter sp.]